MSHKVSSRKFSCVHSRSLYYDVRLLLQARSVLRIVFSNMKFLICPGSGIVWVLQRLMPYNPGVLWSTCWKPLP